MTEWWQRRVYTMESPNTYTPSIVNVGMVVKEVAELVFIHGWEVKRAGFELLLLVPPNEPGPPFLGTRIVYRGGTRLEDTL